jgi:hypothetical protein
MFKKNEQTTDRALVSGNTINTPSEQKKALFITTRKKLFIVNGWRCCGH